MIKIRGFTLIEVLVVMAIVATLLSLVVPRYFAVAERSKETILKHDLSVMRDAIDQYYSDLGAYPDRLDDLVDRQYLRAIPPDPITESDLTWQVIPPKDIDIRGNVYDVYSGAEGFSVDGSRYSQW